MIQWFRRPSLPSATPNTHQPAAVPKSAAPKPTVPKPAVTSPAPPELLPSRLRAPQENHPMPDTTTPSAALSVDTSQAMALVSSLKAELEQAGRLDNPATRDKVAWLEKLAQALQSNLKASAAAMADKRFQTERQRFGAIATLMRQAVNMDMLQELTVTAVRKHLNADRVVLYRCQDEARGMVVAESLQNGFTPSLHETLPLVLFGLSEAQQTATINDRHSASLTPYQHQLWDRFQIQASLAIPVVHQGQWWGVLAVQHCHETRHWQEAERSLLEQVVLEFLLHWQALEGRSQRLQQQMIDRLLAQLSRDLRQHDSQEDVFTTMLAELRRLLRCDRVALYRYDDPCYFWVESVTAGLPFFSETSPPPILQDLYSPKLGHFSDLYAVSDIHQADYSAVQVDLLERLEIQAHLSVPIRLRDKPWGLLIAYNHRNPHQWNDQERSWIAQVGNQASLALQQVQYERQLVQAADRERTIVRLLEKVRQTLDVNTIFRIATRELRQLLQTDRVGIYRFDPDWSGEFVAESVSGDWPILVGTELARVKDTYLQNSKGGRYVKNESLRVDNIYTVGHDECHINLLEQWGTKAYMISPIFQGTKLWGLLGVYQNSAARAWTDDELTLLQQVCPQLGVVLQQAENVQQVQQQSEQIKLAAERERAATQLVDQIRQEQDVAGIFQSATRRLRDLLKVDRVGIYKFDPDWSGEFVAESVASGWPHLVGTELARVQDTYLQRNEGGRYVDNEAHVVHNIRTEGLDECHINLLEKWGTKAYMIAPIFQGTKLWGLLGVYQNEHPREWDDRELAVLMQVGPQLGNALQQAEYTTALRRQANMQTKAIERAEAAGTITDKIRQSQDTDTIFRVATQEVRRALSTDRVVVYQFNPDFSGQVVAESVASGWVSLLVEQTNDEVLSGDRTSNERCILRKWSDGDRTTTDTYLRDTGGGRYKQGQKITVIDNIYTQNFPACYVDSLEKYQAKAYIIAPIFLAGELWGLLGAYQNDNFRAWEDSETNLMMQIANQLAIALQQASYIEELQAQAQRQAIAAERARAAATIIDKVRQSQNPDTIFKVATQEVRRALATDRVVVYQFNPDYSGQVVAESVASGWVSLLIEQTNDEVLSGDRTSNERCILRKWSDGDRTTTDTYLRDTSGGRYVQGQKVTVIDNIYTQNFPTCYVESLEKYQAKAYIIAPIFQNGKLWGLFGAYQNDNFRAWEDSETDLMMQISNQLAVALQQAEYLEQLRIQSEQLTISADRERRDKERLQMQAVQLLSAVLPALDGDLTVRAPLTEDEIGTIADAYNNTIQSLRGIVIQVQGAVGQVTQTSQSSEAAVGELAHQAQAQFAALQEALSQIKGMAAATAAVSQNAQQVDAAVQQTNATVEKGDAAMNRTVEGILQIRETVAETGKRIKRLSESSQKISKVVSLISNFTTQTHLLSLNAAIEATRAGEYGRGFAVVADEVRSLARQSAAATTEIEQLVQEIQAGTAEVSAAMETGIEQVVTGTTLVSDARQNLNAIVDSTAQILQYVSSIQQTAKAQSSQSESVTLTMDAVAAIANETSEAATKLASSFQELLGTAQELQTVTGRFKVN